MKTIGDLTEKLRHLAEWLDLNDAVDLLIAADLLDRFAGASTLLENPNV